MTAIQSIPGPFRTFARGVNFDDPVQANQFSTVLSHNIDAIRQRCFNSPGCIHGKFLNKTTPLSYNLVTHKFETEPTPKLSAILPTAMSNLVGIPSVSDDPKNVEDFFLGVGEKVSQIAKLNLTEFATLFSSKRDEIETGLVYLSEYYRIKERRPDAEMTLERCHAWVKPLCAALSFIIPNKDPFVSAKDAYKLLDLETNALLKAVMTHKSIMERKSIEEILGDHALLFFKICLFMETQNLESLLNNLLLILQDSTKEDQKKKFDFRNVLLNENAFSSLHPILLKEALKLSWYTHLDEAYQLSTVQKALTLVKKKIALIKSDPTVTDLQKSEKITSFLSDLIDILEELEPYKTVLDFLHNFNNKMKNPRNPGLPFTGIGRDASLKFFVRVIMKVDNIESIDLNNSQHRKDLIACADFIIVEKLTEMAAQKKKLLDWIALFPEASANPEIKTLLDEVQ